MSSIVYITNKSNGNVYAYRSVSYRDPETKKPKTKRTYLGRVDPATGEILPKGENGKRNRGFPKSTPGMPQDAAKELQEQAEKIRELQQSLDWYKEKSRADDLLLRRLAKSVQDHEQKWTDTR